MTMNRRDFLRMGGFLTVSTATVGLTGCFHDEDDAAAVSAPEATGSNWAFPQSIASADPKPDGIILWSRVTASSLSATGSATGDVSVRLYISTDSLNASEVGLAGGVLRGSIPLDNNLCPALAQYDGTIRKKLTGLQPSKVYYYQFVAGAVRSRVGRFKTAPAEATAPSQLKFAFMSCQDWNSNHWGAFDDIVAKDIAYGTANAGAPQLDFVVHLGDYIYETNEYSSGTAESRHGRQTFPDGNSLNGITHAASLADYRYLYKSYRSDPRIQAFHERFPIIATWDDHEFSDDSYGDAETYTNANTKQTTRRQVANQAWFEFMPADVTFNTNATDFKNIQLYRDLKFGSLMHLVMTDERLYRADHLISESTISPISGQELGRINSRYLTPEASLKGAELTKIALANVTTGGTDSLNLVSILGKAQRDWWKTTMKNSTATWKFWGNEVSLLRMGVNGTNAVTTLLGLSVGKTIGELPSTLLQGAPQQAASKVFRIAEQGLVAGGLITSTIANTAADNAALAIYTALGADVSNTTKQATAGANAGAALASTLGAPLVAYFMGLGQDLTTAQASANTTITNLATASIPLAISAYAAYCVRVAAALVAGVTFGLSSALAGAGASAAAQTALNLANLASSVHDISDATLAAAITAAATYYAGGNPANITATHTTIAQIAVGAYKAVVQAQVGGLSSSQQLGAAAQVMVTAIAAPTSTHPLKAFLQKFLYNADQWDGYQAERKSLMNFLLDPNGDGSNADRINNVVAITGDIHAFFAGQAFNDYAGEVTAVTAGTSGFTENPGTAAAAGTAAMVDLVTTGISSTSWFSYLKDVVGAGALTALQPLVFFNLTPAQTGLPFTLTLPVLEFTLGKPFTVAALTTITKDALKKQIATSVPRIDPITGLPATSGVPEAAFAISVATAQGNTAAANAITSALASGDIAAANVATNLVIDGIVALIAANTQLQGLCSTLAAMNSNPWLQYMDTDAQGYAVVTLSGTELNCQFHRVNHMLDLSPSALATSFAPGVFSGAAPNTPADTRPIVSRTTTFTVAVNSTTISAPSTVYNT